MGLFSRPRPARPRAMAFVDYEHWFYSYKNLFSMTPDIEAWRDELAEDFDIEEIVVFGNFSENFIGPQRERLEKLGVKVVHTGISASSNEKDFTDFIMLDYIYQAAARRDIDVYVLFTGDGHFSSVVHYIRTKLNKRIIVYGVNKAFSQRLKSEASSYVEMPRYEQEQQFYVDLVLNALEKLTLQKKNPSYSRTISTVAHTSRVARERIKWAMDYLLDKGYVSEKTVRTHSAAGKGQKDSKDAARGNEGGRRNGSTEHKVLEVDWIKVKKDGIWSKIS